MGRKLDADSYLPCLKCNVWLPNYAKEIHELECQELGLSSFSHPYISDSVFYGRVLFIESGKQFQEGSSKVADKEEKKIKKKTNENVTDKKQKKATQKRQSFISSNTFPEPDWIKKISASFHYRLVLLNERDLIRCHITAYNPVLLTAGVNYCAFLAVPDENIRIGNIVLYDIGSSQYLPNLEQRNSMITLRKITDVRIPDELVLRPSRDALQVKEWQFLEHQLKNLLFAKFPLGAPFTLNVGCTVHYCLSGKVSQSFTVAACKWNDENVTVHDELEDLKTGTRNQHENQAVNDGPSAENSSSIPSQFITLDACTVSDTSSIVENFSKLQISNSNVAGGYITVDEYKAGDSTGEESIKPTMLTSTPKKEIPDEENLYKYLLASKTGKGSISTIMFDKTTVDGDGSVSYPTLPWVRVGMKTKITIQHSQEIRDSSMIETQEEIYCRDSSYYSLKKVMQNKLKDEIVAPPLLGGWNGVLLSGPPGTGKSLLMKEIARELAIPVISVTLTDIAKSSGSADEFIRQKFAIARERSPSVVFLDDVDCLCPSRESRSRNSQDVTAFVVKEIDALQRAARPVLLIAATNRIDLISSKLRCPGRLDKEIVVALPDVHQRQQILQHLLSFHESEMTESDIHDVAKEAHGFSGADLNALLRSAWFNAVKRIDSSGNISSNRRGLSLTREDLDAGRRNVVPAMLRQNLSAVSRVKWNDIWGYTTLKTKLQAMAHLHMKEPDKNPLKGTLLYGPPGCSKTMFVRALVNETSFSFFPLKCSDLLSRYVGETEKSLNRVFDSAQQAAPSIIFMDEVDSLCGDRGKSSGLVTELLTLMSRSSRRGNILVIGATNRPHAVDEALLRPGGLEQIIHVDLPDYNCRCEIWQGLLNNVPIEGDVDIRHLSEATEGYSGAEITGIYQESAQEAISKLCLPISDHLNGDQKFEKPFFSTQLLFETIRRTPARTPSSILHSINLFSSQRQLQAIKL